jgi:hypothetical protein
MFFLNWNMRLPETQPKSQIPINACTTKGRKEIPATTEEEMLGKNCKNASQAVNIYFVGLAICEALRLTERQAYLAREAQGHRRVATHGLITLLNVIRS